MSPFLIKDKPFSKKWLKSYFLILIGTFILSIGYVYFITPYKIIPGGVYGISIILHHIFGTPVGLTSLFFNIPLTIIGTKILGPRFGAKTVTGFILTSAFVDILAYFSNYEPLVQDNALLSAIFGGVTMGIGVGLIFKSRATSGGSDVVAMIFSKFTKIPLGQMLMSVDAVIVVLGLAILREWEIPLYSLIVIFIMGKVIDVVLQGISAEKTLFIISEKHEELRKTIIEDIHRGGTFIHGEGMYNGSHKKIIFTSVNRREMAILMDHINTIDPKAFVTVLEAQEILGEGFKSLKDKLED